MGAGSSIEWTDHTFNPWWGCQKVSPGCQHCYAETMATRFERGIWGPPHATDRRLFGEKHWAEPLKWNRQAEAAGVPARVFCASMADVFEAHPQVVEARERLWSLIDETPWLTWLLLTKRPVAVFALTPDRWWRDGWPSNVWLGTSVEDQKRADARIPELLRIPATVRFLSCEPLLGPVSIERWLHDSDCTYINEDRKLPRSIRLCICDEREVREVSIDWVIVGGESGPGARPMHPQWVRDLQDQCTDARVPFLFKQWGAWQPVADVYDEDLDVGDLLGRHVAAVERSGDIPQEHLADDRTYRVDHQPAPGSWWMERVGKKAAGRELDGRTWDEFPTTVEVSA